MQKLIQTYRNIQQEYSKRNSKESEIILDLVDKVLGMLEIITENQISTGTITGFDKENQTVTIELDDFDKTVLVIGAEAEVSVGDL